MNTAETVRALDAKHTYFLQNRRAVMTVSNNKEPVKGEIRGYLRGLANSGVITELQFRQLLTYYTL